LSKNEIQIIENNNTIFNDLKSKKTKSSEFNKAKKDLTKEIIDKISDLVDATFNNDKNDEFINNVGNEIVSGHNGIILQKIIIYK